MGSKSAGTLITLTVDVDTKVIAEALRLIGKEAPKSVKRALDRTIVSTRELIVDMTTAKLNMTEKNVRKRLFVRPSFAATAAIVIRAKPSPLLDFKGTTYAQKSGRGVSFRPFVSGDRVRLKHAFIAVPQNGVRRVFTRDIRNPKHISRRGRLEQKLIAVTSLFVSQYINTPKRINAISFFMLKRFRSHLVKDLKFRLNRRIQLINQDESA